MTRVTFRRESFGFFFLENSDKFSAKALALSGRGRYIHRHDGSRAASDFDRASRTFHFPCAARIAMLAVQILVIFDS